MKTGKKGPFKDFAKKLAKTLTNDYKSRKGRTKRAKTKS